MLTRTLLAAASIALCFTAQAHDVAEKDPMLRFAFNATALEASLVQPVTYLESCEKHSDRLPAEVTARFKQWREDNAELLANIGRWSARSDEIVAAGSAMSPADIKTSKETQRLAIVKGIEASFAALPSSDVPRACTGVSQVLEDDSLKRDPDLQEHFKAVKELEAMAFANDPGMRQAPSD